MGDKSKIEWTDASWTPIRARNKATGKVGWYCEHATPGCEHCYAESMNARLGTGLSFKPGHRKDVELFLDEDMLLQPLRWKKPRMIFVCSMTDLFADFVPDEEIDQVFAVMALCPQHTFQVLTKRADRMREYFAARTSGDPWAEAADAISDMLRMFDHVTVLEPRDIPRPNVWLGVSAEDQKRADERIPHLLETPAAVRFVSAEPLLGPIDISRYCWPVCAHWPSPYQTPEEAKAAGANVEYKRQSLVSAHAIFLDWIIVGGESGLDARPMHPDWARSIRDQCQCAGVAFFLKQWGEWKEAFHDEDGPHVNHVDNESDEADALLAALNGKPGWLHRDGRFFTRRDQLPEEEPFRLMERIGKRAAGRLLDGREHNEMPERAS